MIDTYTTKQIISAPQTKKAPYDPKALILSRMSSDCPHKEHIINSVLAEVQSFAPLSDTITEEQDGAGTPKLFLRVWPVSSVKSVSVNGEDITDKVQCVKHLGMLVMKDGTRPRWYANIVIEYTAWYERRPDDLLSAIVGQVEFLGEQMSMGNITSEKISNYAVTFSQNAPSWVGETFSKYQGVNV